MWAIQAVLLESQYTAQARVSSLSLKPKEIQPLYTDEQLDHKTREWESLWRAAVERTSNALYLWAPNDDLWHLLTSRPSSASRLPPPLILCPYAVRSVLKATLCQYYAQWAAVKP